MHVAAKQEGRAPRLPATVAYGLLALRQAAGGREQERERQIGLRDLVEDLRGGD
jgi:hypothetical protein